MSEHKTNYEKYRATILKASAKWKKENPLKCREYNIAYWNRQVGIDNNVELSPEARELRSAYNRKRYERKTEPVRHGHWIHTGFMEVKCNNCGNVFHELEDTNYCPNCGAKMDEVNDETK